MKEKRTIEKTFDELEEFLQQGLKICYAAKKSLGVYPGTFKKSRRNTPDIARAAVRKRNSRLFKP
jgi:hypothetical protein